MYRKAGVVFGISVLGVGVLGSVYQRFFKTSPSTHLLNDLDAIITTIDDEEVIATCRNYRSLLVNYAKRIESIISDLEALNSFKFGDAQFPKHVDHCKTTMELHLQFIENYAVSLENAENSLLKCLNSATQSKIDIATGKNGLAVHIVEEVKKVTWAELVKGDTVAVMILETLFTNFNAVVSSSTIDTLETNLNNRLTELKQGRDDLILEINSRLEFLKQLEKQKITEQLLRKQLKTWIGILQNHLTKVQKKRKEQEEQQRREEQQRKQEAEQRQREEEQRRVEAEKRQQEEEQQRKQEAEQRQREEEQRKAEEEQRQQEAEQRQREEEKRKEQEEQQRREEQQRKEEEQRKQEAEQRQKEELQNEAERKRQEEKARQETNKQSKKSDLSFLDDEALFSDTSSNDLFSSPSKKKTAATSKADIFSGGDDFFSSRSSAAPKKGARSKADSIDIFGASKGGDIFSSSPKKSTASKKDLDDLFSF